MTTTFIELVDGPAKGTTKYFTPLPHTLVVATKHPTRWHDYTKTATRPHPTYTHSEHCPCHHKKANT